MGSGSVVAGLAVAFKSRGRKKKRIYILSHSRHAPLFEKHFGNVVSIQEGYHSFLGTKSDEKDGSILFKVKNENLVCNLPVLPNVYASGDVGGPLRLDVGCVKVLGNKLCPSCRAFATTSGEIIHDAQCGAQALKERRAAAANVAKKKTFESLIVDNKVEVARAAGKAKAMAARDGIGFCPAYNQTALPCKTAARCRYAPCVNFEALLHTAFKDTVYERMPSAVRLWARAAGGAQTGAADAAAAAAAARSRATRRTGRASLAEPPAPPTTAAHASSPTSPRSTRGATRSSRNGRRALPAAHP